MVDTAVSLGVKSYIVDLGFSTVTPFQACCFLLTIPRFGFRGDSAVKTAPANAEDMSLVPGLGRCPGVGNGNPPQYSCLENSTDRGSWWATVHGVAKRVGHDLVTKQ